MSLPFLLEIGAEEIPDWMIPGALESMGSLFAGLNIPAENVKLDATPRRLVLRAEGLPEKLPDAEERMMGPARSVPAKAVEGFARKLGVGPRISLSKLLPRVNITAIFEKWKAGRSSIFWPSRCPA